MKCENSKVMALSYPARLAASSFDAQLVELDGQELDGHVAVERLGVRPALHAVFVGELLVHREEGVQLVVVDMPVLEGAGVHHVVDAVEISSHSRSCC